MSVGKLGKLGPTVHLRKSDSWTNLGYVVVWMDPLLETYFKLSSGPGDVNLLLDELSLIMPGTLSSNCSSETDTSFKIFSFHSLGAATVQAALEFMTPGKTFEEQKREEVLVFRPDFFGCSLGLFAPAAASTFTPLFAGCTITTNTMQTIALSNEHDTEYRMFRFLA